MLLQAYAVRDAFEEAVLRAGQQHSSVADLASLWVRALDAIMNAAQVRAV